MTRDEYERSPVLSLSEYDVIVVSGMMLKNRFGPTNVLYNGILGHCRYCGHEIKERELFLSKSVGCLC